jgi:hypothetical protein
MMKSDKTLNIVVAFSGENFVSLSLTLLKIRHLELQKNIVIVSNCDTQKFKKFYESNRDLANTWIRRIF